MIKWAVAGAAKAPSPALDNPSPADLPFSVYETKKGFIMANEKILIIDDDDDIAHALRLPLEAAGYNVTRATNGEAGLQKVKEINPDLIILDVMMDSSTEGFHVSLALRSPDPASEYKAYSQIPILMLTSIHTTTSLRFAPDRDYLPVDAFVEKPIAPADLLKKVREFLSKKKA
jgi:CheY-like chemotaxis protein